jgi:hypothetical protein
MRKAANAMSRRNRESNSLSLSSSHTLHSTTHAAIKVIEQGQVYGRQPADMHSTQIKLPASWKTLVQLSEAMAAVDAAAAGLCEGLSDEQLTWTPYRGRWSVAQNLAHLRMTAEVFLPSVDHALETCRKLKLRSEGPFRLTPYGRLLVWRMDARPVIKMRAPVAVYPQLLGLPGLELAHFLASQAAMRQRMESAEGLDLTALRFASPLARYVRVNLLEFFFMFNAHARRHLCQAGKVREALPRPNYQNVRAMR